MAARSGETPSISSSNYANTVYAGGAVDAPTHVVHSTAASGWQVPAEERRVMFGKQEFFDPNLALRGMEDDKELMRRVQAAVMPKQPQQQQQPKKEEPMGARIVKVYIADPDEALALDKRVLYKGDEQLTESSDQELYFDIAVGDLLKDHNKMRTATLDKKATAKTDKDVFLEPIRIRDLKMVVVTIAQF